MADESRFHVVLVEPEIPPNTGTIARLCGATNTTLHLVHPLGFSTDDRYLKRAGLDYWQHVTIVHWPNFAAFVAAHPAHRLYLFSKKSSRPYTEARFLPGDLMVFGKETQGLPEDFLNSHPERCYTVPMANQHIRSLNLAMTAGIVLYEALRQQGLQFPAREHDE
jgi:tRNA (cytidine/uridine-2'-O-)-methyltransferase